MVSGAGQKLLKVYDNDMGYTPALSQAFTGFPEDVGFNKGLSAPQPDFVEGLQRLEYKPFPLDELDGAVLYKDNTRSLTLPHLAGEWKGPDGNLKEGTLQSGYDGAALVYARNQALSYLGISDPPGQANITTFATNGTQLKLFAHYAAPSGDDGTLEYHQYPIESTVLTGSRRNFQEGRRWARNGQDYARDQSYAPRDQLKERWKKGQHHGGPGPGPTEE